MNSLILFLALNVGQITGLDAPTTPPPQPTDFPTLDAAILQKRLPKIFGEYGHRRKSFWEVAKEGQSENWTWDGRKKFECPHPKLWDCNQWIPMSFKWFLTWNNWMEPWVAFEREGFLLENSYTPENQMKSLSLEGLTPTNDESDSSNTINFGNPDPGENVDLDNSQDESAQEPVRIVGKRLALEKWKWTNQEGKSIYVYLSLRNQWIERIDYDNTVEYIEWHQKNRWVRPSIVSVILERNGIRASFHYQISHAHKKVHK